MSEQNASFDRVLSDAKKELSSLLSENNTKTFSQDLSAIIKRITIHDLHGYWGLRQQVKDLLSTLPGDSVEDRVIVFKLLMFELIEYQLNNNIYYLQSESLLQQAQKRFMLLIKKHLKYTSDDYHKMSDMLLKDFALCSGKLVSTGLVAYCVTKLSKKNIIENIFKLPYLINNKLLGYVIEGHVDNRYYHLFTSEGFKSSYALATEILRISPEIKGVFGRSWYYDPILLNKVSPELKFTADFQLENGGKLLSTKAEQIDIEFATSRSKVRRNLYEEGLYVPRGYILIWDRDNILKWVQSERQISRD